MAQSGTVTRAGHSATYIVAGSILKITSVFGTKAAQLGRTPADVLAGKGSENCQSRWPPHYELAASVPYGAGRSPQKPA